MSQEKNYESTVMRVAGNLLSGVTLYPVGDNTTHDGENDLVYRAVRRARKIIAEVQRTAPKVDPAEKP